MSHYHKIPNRQSNRLKGYDYSQIGIYFVTICCYDGASRFGNIVHDEMVLNEYGHIAFNEWLLLSIRYPNCEFDVFQIMPNHLHGIIVINDVDLCRAEASPASKMLSNIVGAYKSIVANICLGIYKIKGQRMGQFWQRNYHDHIICNDLSYKKIIEYIMSNPQHWENDKFFIH